ncbi:Cas9 inhibitor AcrIIA9 family protein [uncultured Tissierella sp.]|uniref:Cas9 inhibitor AcrIIA9 family protein n=1 Tax=uncultured Tissierella sp. TaxID=448160 RepID=UPI002805200B|nr:Cas9 inhibitor AcrIIA9 family protein [uncultured Tissierella sp.]MDU5080268.1 Cas9 inhibitor AcrIIA9 family protein [Bacillota bacterium]
MSETINRAKEKLTQELKDFKGGKKESAVSSYVEKTLKEFCKEEAFASAVLNSKKTLTDCCNEIMNKCGNYISDFEVYKKAAQFYFPNAKVDFTMSIKVDKDSVVVSNQMPKELKHDSPKTKSNKNKKYETLADTIQISLFEN